MIVLDSFSAILKIGIMFACLKTNSNVDFLTDIFKLECKKSANISANSLVTLAGTSVC